MKSVFKCTVYSLLLTIAVLISCKKELDCYDCKENKPPIAVAGSDQKITLPKDSVLLDGSASSDPDGQITMYKWGQISGPVSSNIIKQDSSKTLVRALKTGVYQFELTVTDNGGLSTKDTVQVIVDDPAVNQPPVANAGADRKITLPADSAILDGTASFDPDGTITSYKWVKIAGPGSPNIIKQDSSKTLVKALVMGVYKFELTVTDNGGLSAKDTMQVMVDNPLVNQPPIACAGADQTINLPTNAVNVDGSCSTDPDNNISGFVWTKISGPSTFNITNTGAAQTQVTALIQGTYQFELKVTDAGGLFSKDTVTITVNSTLPIYNCDDTNRPRVNAQLTPIGTLSQSGSLISVLSAGNNIVFASSDTNYGSIKVDIYNVTSKAWTKGESAKGRAREGMAVVSAGNKIFFAGGATGDGAPWILYADVDIYDVSTNTWSGTSLSEPRAFAAAATVGNKVLFAGGLINGRTWDATSHVDIYDLTSNTWSARANVSDDRSEMTAITFNNKIYFAGGVHDGTGGSLSNKIDIYDNNATNSWSTSTLSEAKTNVAGIGVDNNVYWAGGYIGNSFSCRVEMKNTNNQNTSFTNLSRPGTVAAVIKSNKILFFPAPTWFSVTQSEFDTYDVPTGTWSIGVLPVKVQGVSIISHNNIVYVAGGFVNGVTSDKVYQLDF